VNSRPEEGMSRSIRLGVAGLADLDVDGVVIALADMPLITPSHIGGLIAACDQRGIVASKAGDRLSPPAYFSREHFRALSALSGDVGARALLAEGAALDADADMLTDVDTFEDLERLR
jgi:molybdenum cofactor cytidylyltransferase